MNEFELNLRLKQEMESLAPNRLEALLAACDQTPRPVYSVSESPAPRRRQWPRLVAAAAAVLILAGGTFFGVRDMQCSEITVDAGVEFSMRVNGFDRVKSVSVSPGGQGVVDARKMTGQSLDDAIALAAEELVAADRFTGNANGVLVSVQKAGKHRADVLSEHVSEKLIDAAATANFEPAVLCQKVMEGQSGLEALRSAVTAHSAGFSAEQVSQLDLQELLYVVKSQGLSWENASLTGALANWSLDSAADAEAIALQYIGLDTSESLQSSVLSVFSDQLAYRVTGSNWEYWISAATGEILDGFFGGTVSSPGSGAGSAGYYSGDPVQDTVDFVKDVIDEPRRVKSIVDYLDWLF